MASAPDLQVGRTDHIFGQVRQGRGSWSGCSRATLLQILQDGWMATRNASMCYVGKRVGDNAFREAIYGVCAERDKVVAVDLVELGRGNHWRL